MPRKKKNELSSPKKVADVLNEGDFHDLPVTERVPEIDPPVEAEETTEEKAPEVVTDSDVEPVHTDEDRADDDGFAQPEVERYDAHKVFPDKPRNEGGGVTSEDAKKMVAENKQKEQE